MKLDGRNFKVIFLGSAGVGKTSIILSFMYDRFLVANEPTIGVDFFTRSISIGNNKVTLSIWDTAGQEQYSSLAPIYIRDSDFIVLVYNVNDPGSLESAKNWYQRANDLKNDRATFILAGNKNDLEDITDENDIEMFVSSTGMKCYKVSAKTSDGIVNLFNEIALMAMEKSTNEIKTVDHLVLPSESDDEETHEQRATPNSRYGCC